MEEEAAYDEESHFTINLEADTVDEFPVIDIFFNKDTIYMNKDYLMAENEINRFDKIEEEYIGWPLVDAEGIVSAYGIGQEEKKQLEDIIENLGVEIPVKVSGRTYTLNLNHEQMVDIVMAALQSIYDNLDEINKVSGLDIDKEQLGMIYGHGETGIFNNIYKKMWDGSKLEMKASFSNTKMNGTYKGKLSIWGSTNVDFSMDLSLKKADKQKVIMPQDAKVLTLEEYWAYKEPYIAEFWVDKKYENLSFKEVDKVINNLGEEDYLECFKTNGKWYVATDVLTTFLPYTLRYDEVQKKYYLVSDNEMEYAKFNAAVNALNESYELGEVSDEVYDQKYEELWANCNEVKGAKRLYLNTVQFGYSVYVQLSDLHAFGFESEIGSIEEEGYSITYIDLYEPIGK